MDPGGQVHTWFAEVRERTDFTILVKVTSQCCCNVSKWPLPSEGTKKQAPPPPKQFSPFASQASNAPSSPHYPPITPRRNPSKDSLIQAPSHPPPQPPLAPHAQGEAESSPPSSPTPPGTPPSDGPQSSPLSCYQSGSLPRPSRPAPKPRPRPSMPPPPQPAGNDTGNGVCGSSSKIITGRRPHKSGFSMCLFPVRSDNVQQHLKSNQTWNTCGFTLVNILLK